MAPEEGRNVCNKLITITLAEIFVIKIPSKIFGTSRNDLALSEQQRLRQKI